MSEILELSIKILSVLQQNSKVLSSHEEALKSEEDKMKLDKNSIKNFHKIGLLRKNILESIKLIGQACLNEKIPTEFVFTLLQNLLEPTVVSCSIAIEAFALLLTSSFSKLVLSEKNHLLFPLLINLQTIVKYSPNYPLAVKKNVEELVEWCNKLNVCGFKMEFDKQTPLVCSEQKLDMLRKAHIETFFNQ